MSLIDITKAFDPKLLKSVLDTLIQNKPKNWKTNKRAEQGNQEVWVNNKRTYAVRGITATGLT